MHAQHPSGDLTAIAFKFAAVLESYQSQIERLATDWRNRPLYRAVSAQLDELRSLLGALPQLAVDMVEVAVCHVKLLHLLQAEGGAGDVSEMQLRQTAAVRTLRRKTLRLISNPAA